MTERLEQALRELVQAEADGHRHRAVVRWRFRLDGDRVRVTIQSHPGQAIEARRAVTALGGEIHLWKWGSETNESINAWVPVGALVDVAAHDTVKWVEQRGAAWPYPPALVDPNAPTGCARLSSLEPDLLRLLQAPDRDAFVEVFNCLPPPPREIESIGIRPQWERDQPPLPRMIRLNNDKDRVLIRLEMPDDIGDFLQQYDLSVVDRVALDWYPPRDPGSGLMNRFYTFARLDTVCMIGEDPRVVRLQLPGYTEPGQPYAWTVRAMRHGRWPINWGGDRPRTIPSELPWPPPIPDPNSPLSPEQERLGWMDIELLEVVLSSNPVAMAGYINAFPLRKGKRLHLQGQSLSVSVELAGEEGDLATRFAFQTVRRYPASDLVPYAQVAALVPINQLCGLASDARVRRIQAPGPTVDLLPTQDRP
ncbi:MAG: hypothetical protein IT306_19470 [Chloroflexi bacterium]|nr:hypothetical protein [Chloroflexota bacterium]